MNIGLKIDVDTYRGTRSGVPNLVRLLAEEGIRATFFFSVGPDNMGRHLFRLLKPTFLWKMLRTKAASLYGWDILLRGTLWPGPIIGRKLAPVIRLAADAGHEIGIHAWDHHAWQNMDSATSGEKSREWLERSGRLLAEICGKPATCSGAPGWRCDDAVLRSKDAFHFAFNSDCRGDRIFLPVVDGRPLRTPQVPTTLPTYDEVVGQNGATAEDYYRRLFDMLNPDGLNILTIHAEVEGIIAHALFRQFLKEAKHRGISFTTLGSLVGPPDTLPRGKVVPREIPGREGWLAFLEPA